MSNEHPLSHWLWQNRLTPKQFAEMAGTSSARISQIVRHWQTPGLKLAFAIEEATKGGVKAADFVKMEQLDDDAHGV